MSDTDDALETTPEAEGSETTPEAEGSDPAAALALARKRQGGAENARQIAEAKAAALEKELAGYREANQTAAEKDLTELAKAQARAEAAEKRAQEAETAANAKVLDKLYPEARAKFPEITDEVRLAELQVFYAKEAPFTPPTPMRHNESKTSAAGARKPAERTAADVKAELLAMPLPEGW